MNRKSIYLVLLVLLSTLASSGQVITSTEKQIWHQPLAVRLLKRAQINPLSL